MECPVCYKPEAYCNLMCGHSFCYQCLYYWYQECKKYTCPMCRESLCIMSKSGYREVYIECVETANIDEYINFHKMLNVVKPGGFILKDVEYLKRQPWVKWVMEHRANNPVYTTYIFNGLQGTKKARYQERQEE